MNTDRLYLCVHGHFYQPPRENAWLEEIEEQRSASPWHDWNERIHDECYLPNTRARVLDGQGKILDVMNNFEKISFNFGPTLMSWLETKHPRTYQLILEADQQSQKVLGHGNAMAQAYSHIIMPLANRRDKATQVKWGIEDFRHRFKRDPESMWLPETAVNDECLDVLIEQGMKFVILEPQQAQAIKPIEGGNWQDVSQGQIDPKRPYRYFSKIHPGKFIEVFFYDGPISKAIGFEDVLTDAKRLMGRMEMAKVNSLDPQLIHVATDGETYGHHKVFGDRVLAYLLKVEAPSKGFQITNYASYLEKYPPTFAVSLKPGEEGLGTSWSCPHGVKRWKDHCGCRGEGPAEWTQHWRRPLRESLDWLRDELARIYEEHGAKYLKDVWQARNEYIQVVLNRSEENVRSFIEKHGVRSFNQAERVNCLKLLEMQRHALLMYTSCGWFFTELSGIETVQVIQYAARAIELAQEAAHSQLEEEFLKRLSQAKSNVPEFKDGRGVYEKLIRSSIISIQSIASLFAVGSTLEHFYSPEEPFKIYHYLIEPLHLRRESFGDMTLNFGRVKVTSEITSEEQDLIFIAVQFGLRDFRSSFKPFHDTSELEAMEKEFFEWLHTSNIVELLRKIDQHFGEKYYALKDLPFRERKEILSILTKEAVEKIAAIHENIFDDNRKLTEVYRAMHLSIPKELRFAAEHTFSKRLLQNVMNLAEQNFSLKKARPIYRIIEDATALGVDLNRDQTKIFLTAELVRRTEALVHDPQAEQVSTCVNIIKLARKIGVEIDLRPSQDHLFEFLKRYSSSPEKDFKLTTSTFDHLLQLADSLGINIEEYKKKINNALSA